MDLRCQYLRRCLLGRRGRDLRLRRGHPGKVYGRIHGGACGQLANCAGTGLAYGHPELCLSAPNPRICRLPVLHLSRLFSAVVAAEPRQAPAVLERSDATEHRRSEPSRRVLSEVVAYTRVEADGKTVTSYPPSGTGISAAAPTVPAADNASQWTAGTGPHELGSRCLCQLHGRLCEWGRDGGRGFVVRSGTGRCLLVPSVGDSRRLDWFRGFAPRIPKIWQRYAPIGFDGRDNSSTTCIDNSPAFNLIPPSTAPAIPSPLDAGQWNARSNYPGSNVWTPGNQVSYAVSYLYKNAQSAGETAIGPWSPWATVGAFAYPILSPIPLPAPLPAGSPFEYVGRRIYRQAQVPGGSGNSIIQSQTLVFELDEHKVGPFPRRLPTHLCPIPSPPHRRVLLQWLLDPEIDTGSVAAPEARESPQCAHPVRRHVNGPDCPQRLSPSWIAGQPVA